jgi:hypothetical protein
LFNEKNKEKVIIVRKARRLVVEAIGQVEKKKKRKLKMEKKQTWLSWRWRRGS